MALFMVLLCSFLCGTQKQNNVIEALFHAITVNGKGNF